MPNSRGRPAGIWTQDALATRSRVSLSTVRDFEKGRQVPIANNLNAMRRAIEVAGLALLFSEGGKALGVTVADDAQAGS